MSSLLRLCAPQWTGGRTDKTIGSREVSNLNIGKTDGFLITSMTGQEFKSYSEIRQLLEHYHTEIYGDRQSWKNQEEIGDGDGLEGNETRKLEPFFEESEARELAKRDDIDDALESELKHMRSIKRHFRQLKTLCRNVIFIVVNERVSQADPDEIIRRIFDDIAKNKVQQTRYTFKLYPIMAAFRPNPTSAKETITQIFNEKLSDSSTYPLIRGSHTVGKEEREKIIEAVADQVVVLKPDWVVSRDNCDVMIMIVAMQKLCCMSLLVDFFDYCKYNLHEFNKKHVTEFDDKSDEKPTYREAQTSANQEI